MKLNIVGASQVEAIVVKESGRSILKRIRN
jgi:hypothetical protein